MTWLPKDHAIFSCLNHIDAMRFREGKGDWKETSTAHALMGMNIGCRAAIIFSPIDVSWGWDAAKKPIEGGFAVRSG